MASRILILVNGRVTLDWSAGSEAAAPVPTASVAKSVYVSMLGAAIADGVIESLDSYVVDYFPQILDVKLGQGPKPDRASGPTDAIITFRQLAGHTSGFLKPGESPGERFHYQTFGMNVLAHAIETAYAQNGSRSDSAKVLVSFGDLLESRIRNRVGGRWTWRIRNFSGMGPAARADIFGDNIHVVGDARDLALLGWLWACDGNWFGDQILPPGWVKVCTQPSQTTTEIETSHGLGFWLNTQSKLWPSLPADSFAAWGRGGFYVWVYPKAGIVAVTAPAVVTDDDATTLNETLVPELVAALT